MINVLCSIGWQKLGLQPDMATGGLAKDLSQAKLAIDSASALADQLMPLLDDEDRRTMANLIRDLRVNYVQKVQEG
jgi:hypothetical protein